MNTAAHFPTRARSAAVLGEYVTLAVSGTDKYGRLLAAVVHDRIGDMSSLLLRQGHAVAYDGGRRDAWHV